MASVVIKTEPEETKDHLQTCRLCLSEESTECALLEQNLRQWISDYLSIVISTEDGLSQNVCAICRTRLTEFHQFRERCKEVQSTLQCIIQTENLEIKTELPLNNWNVKNEPASKKSCIEENDTKSIHTEIDNETTSQRNWTISESSSQNLHTNSEGEEALTNGQSIGIKEVIIKNEFEYDRESPVSSTDDPPSTSGDEKIQCTICNVVFSKKTQLYNHRFRNHGKTYSCSICKRPFKSRYDLARHSLIHEAKDAKPFKCDICQRPFKRKSDIGGHKTRVHGPRMHKCSICGFSFTRRADLARHIQSRVHNGEQSKV